MSEASGREGEPNQGGPDQGEPDHGGGNRGRTIAIIVLAVVLAVLVIAVVWLLAARANQGPAPSASPTATTASPTPTPTQSSTTPRPTPTGTGVVTCTVNDLSVALGKGNGAAGSTIVPIVFTNTGSKPCELHGFPGVSFVGNGNGTQLGAAADQDTSVAITQNTLQPGKAVEAPLKITRAENFEGCTLVKADGLRVYPPHSYEAVFVKTTGYSACSNADIHLLAVKPVQAQ